MKEFRESELRRALDGRPCMYPERIDLFVADARADHKKKQIERRGAIYSLLTFVMLFGVLPAYFYLLKTWWLA